MYAAITHVMNIANINMREQDKKKRQFASRLASKQASLRVGDLFDSRDRPRCFVSGLL